MEDELKMQILDKLIEAMDEFEANGRPMGGDKPSDVAVIEEKQIVPAEDAAEVVEDKIESSMSDEMPLMNKGEKGQIKELMGDDFAAAPSRDSLERLKNQFGRSMKRG